MDQNRAKDDSEDERVEQGLAEDKIAQKNVRKLIPVWLG